MVKIEKLKISPSPQRDDLKRLSQEISQQFWIDSKNAELLLKTKTSLSLQEFRQEVQTLWEKNTSPQLSLEQSERLYNIVNWYRKLITAKTELGIETLKQSIQTENPASKSFGQQIGKRYFPDLQKRAQNPENFSDQISGWFLWVFESSITMVDLCYRIGLGIIKSPYDIYRIITWKARYDNWRRI
jgi:hypothetical protein